MDTQEKQYWCDIWNSMKDEQQGRFKDILLIEKSKLNEIEQKYQEDFKKINDNFLKRNRFYNEKKR